MSRRATQVGFSLIEVLVVLILVAIMFGMVGTSVYKGMDGVKLRRAGNDIVNALRFTRGQAIIKHEERFLEVNIADRTFTATDRPSIVLPEGVDVTLRTASMDILDDNSGRIRFYPDGSSTGGRITLKAGERIWRVNVAWLTGEIALESNAGET